jgi:hypothetical protein
MAERLHPPAAGRPGTALVAARASPRVPLVAFGLSLGLFLTITYVLCIGFDLLFPSEAMHENWQRFLPGFIWLTWPSFLLGLIESFPYGWYVALVFCPFFNFFAAKFN